MEKCCENCKYSDVDYIWDNELWDEYPIWTCTKGCEIDKDFECEQYEESKPKTYIEQDTECDKCYKLNECIDKGYLLNATVEMDARQHYIKGRNCICIKGCEEFLEMKLSEVINVAQTEGQKSLLKKAIDQMGDMTYREFYQEGRFLEMV